MLMYIRAKTSKLYILDMYQLRYVYVFGVHSGRDCTYQWILCYLSGLGLTADTNVGHVGKCPRSRTLGAV